MVAWKESRIIWRSSRGDSGNSSVVVAMVVGVERQTSRQVRRKTETNALSLVARAPLGDDKLVFGQDIWKVETTGSCKGSGSSASAFDPGPSLNLVRQVHAVMLLGEMIIILVQHLDVLIYWEMLVLKIKYQLHFPQHIIRPGRYYIIIIIVYSIM
jgi:hypothetical protein